MWAESQPGPSRCQPSRQGYCGYCRVLYSNLEQHLSSLRHLDSVRASSRGSSTVSSASSRTKLTLLERFLQDVLQHHPHRYNDPRPSHADLPSVSAPLLPREELDDLCFSDDDSRSKGTREQLPSSDDASCQQASQKEDRLSAPIREQEEGGAAATGYTQSSHLQTPPPQSQALPSVHRKAHRKTDRRKTSDSSTSLPSHRGPGPGQRPPTELRPCPDPGPSPSPGHLPPSQLRPCPEPSPCLGSSPDTSPGPSPNPGPDTGPSPGPRAHTQVRPCPEPSPCLDSGQGPSLSPQPPTQLRPSPQPGPSLGPSPYPSPVPGPGPGPRLGPRPHTQLIPCPEPGPSPCPGPSPWLPKHLRPCSDSGPSAGPGLGPGPSPHPGPRLPTQLRPCLEPSPSQGAGPGPRPATQLRPCPDSVPSPGPGQGPGPGLRPPSQLRPWLSWQKERREALKEEAFSSDHSDSVDQTIEEVIQRCCHGFSSPPCQQEETDSFHFSLPASMETQSDNWDSPAQRGQTLSQVEEQDLSHLMDVQVDLEDQVYSYQLESALHSDRRARGGARQEQGIWTLPIEEVLPAPRHIPESFRGKTWTQIEQEDEEKVDKLVRQFRRGRFICYFDTESLARYGRRSQNKKSCDESKEEEPDTDVLPLLDHDDDSAYVRRKRKRRAFRVASRCQVVKVSHSTQTVQLVVPAIRQPAAEAPPTSVPVANQEAAERTPEVWRCLPPSYSNIVTPLQPRTSLVYLLCSPSSPAPTYTPSPGSTPKRCRKKRRPLDLQGLKVKYKQLPVRFYDTSSNRILKNLPKGFLWRRGSTSSPPPPCVRQLFRSLSPDLNADRPLGEGAAGSSRVKGQRSSDSPYSHASFLLSTLSRDSAQTDKQDAAGRRGRISQDPPPPPPSRSERGRGGKRDRTRPPPSKRRTKAEATPPQPRREGLRRAGPSRGVPSSTEPPHPPSPRRGRARRGRGCERGRR